jgi:hypothetical protein
MQNRKWRAGRKIASAVAAGVALLGIGIGAGVSQAATVPPGSHTAVIVMTNGNRPVDYTLQNADPFGGTSGALPVGDGEVYDIHWTGVMGSMAWGTGRYWWGRMGSYRNGPVTIGVDQGGGRSLVPWKYTHTDITLTQSWYGTTKGAYPAYGHGAHHTFAHTVVASDDPTTNLYKIKN